MGGSWHRKRSVCLWVIVSCLICWSKSHLDHGLPILLQTYNLIFLSVFLPLQFIQKVGILCGRYQGQNVQVVKFFYFMWFTPLCFYLFFNFWNVVVFFCTKDWYLTTTVDVDYYFIVSYWCFQFTNAAYLQGFFHSWYVMVSSYSN